MSDIIFVGKTQATEDEKSALDYLGRILAHQQVTLITTPKGDSNEAVIEGYKANDGKPTLVSKDLLKQPSDQIIVYTDQKLLAALDKAHPAWRDHKHILLEEDQQLFDLLDLLLAKIYEATGVTVNPF